MITFNKNNNRIIALIAAMSLCFSVLSGCGSKPDYDTEVPSPSANEEVTEVAEAEDTSEEVTKDTEAEESETEEPDTEEIEIEESHEHSISKIHTRPRQAQALPPS